jgi:hypothetical protein
MANFVLRNNRYLMAALGAESAPLRRRHRRSIALCPTHGQCVVGHSPGNVDAARIGRECAVLPGIGGKLVDGEADGLRGRRVQAQLRALRGDTRPNEVGEVRELGAN